MLKPCTDCRSSFDISQDDLEFYDHISPVFAGKKYPIPPPTRCPECRLQRRLAFRNHTALFQVPAHPDGATIFSMYPPTVTFPIMRNDDWFGDSWDPLTTGQDVVFTKPFLEQFREVNKKAPKMARMAVRNENCDYCNYLSDNKNCYLVFNTSNAEDSMCCEAVWGSKDCLECTNTLQSERCYDCTDCLRCYDLQSSAFSENCSESLLLSFCRNCKNCFGCVNLRNKQYCIYNEQKTKEEYQSFIRLFRGQSWSKRIAEQEKFDVFALQHPRPHVTFHQTENCTGNFITEARNVQESFFIQEAEDLKYCFSVYEGGKNCMDYSHSGRNVELLYECSTCVINASRCLFTIQARNNASEQLYCFACESCKHCFGCSGLKRKEYCILNKQYTKEEYETIVPKIIEMMMEDGSWGEFFPMQDSVIPYNRSQAQRYFPLTKNEAIEKGLQWYEENPKEYEGAIKASELPDECPSEAKPIVVRSTQSGQPFRITTQEIERCIELRVPLPRITYEERMDERARTLGGIRLFERTCAKTDKPILTTYPPDSPYIIWDKDEYEKEFQ